MSESPTSSSTRAARFSNLQLRLMTAAVGLPIVIGVSWVGGWPLAVVAGGIGFMAATEFVHGWLLPSRPVSEGFRFWAISAAIGATVLLSHSDDRAPLGAVMLAVLCVGLGYGPVRVAGPRKPYRVFAWSLLYLGVLLSTLVLVRDFDNGRDWFYLALLSTFAVDTGAYTVGRLFGRHKLAPKISPKKTWEGAIGGYISGFAAVVALNAAFDTGTSTPRIMALAVALPIVAQVGDLFESWMKRRMGIKDASRLLPGHGGFLDRLDSVLFVMPAVWLFLEAVA